MPRRVYSLFNRGRLGLISLYKQDRTGISVEGRSRHGSRDPDQHSALEKQRCLTVAGALIVQGIGRDSD